VGRVDFVAPEGGPPALALCGLVAAALDSIIAAAPQRKNNVGMASERQKMQKMLAGAMERESCGCVCALFLSSSLGNPLKSPLPVKRGNYVLECVPYVLIPQLSPLCAPINDLSTLSEVLCACIHALLTPCVIFPYIQNPAPQTLLETPSLPFQPALFGSSISFHECNMPVDQPLVPVLPPVLSSTSGSWAPTGPICFVCYSCYRCSHTQLNPTAQRPAATPKPLFMFLGPQNLSIVARLI
jgi:hypothetical protein